MHEDTGSTKEICRVSNAKKYIVYHSKYSNYSAYFYVHNVLVDISFGFFHVFLLYSGEFMSNSGTFTELRTEPFI